MGNRRVEDERTMGCIAVQVLSLDPPLTHMFFPLFSLNLKLVLVLPDGILDASWVCHH